MLKIFENLNNKANPDRWQSVIALQNMGKPAVEYLVLALKDENKWVRFTAANALGNIGDPRSVDHLIGMLNDEDKDVTVCYRRSASANSETRKLRMH